MTVARPRILRDAAVLGAVLLALVLIPAAPPAWATSFEPRSFRNEVDERRYKALTEELRCLVCQNQNIAASDADLAKDLRDRVYSMIDTGRSDREIVDFMVQRYGDFVLYRPPLNLNTVLLWAGPFVLGLLALFMLLRQVRRAGAASQAPGEPLSPEEHERAMGLLGDEGSTPRDRE